MTGSDDASARRAAWLWTVLLAGVLHAVAPATVRADPLRWAELTVLETRSGAVTITLDGLSYRCRASSPGVACWATATYRVSALGEEVAIVILGTTRGASVRDLDGLVSRWSGSTAPAPARVRPGHSLRLEVVSEVREERGPGPFYGSSCFMHPHGGCPGMYARHALVGRAAIRERERTTLALPPVDSDRDDPLVVTVTHPRGWRVRVEQEAVGVTRDADGRTTRLALLPGSPGGDARLDRSRGGRRDRGGPLVAIGRVARNRPLLRAGYEHPLFTFVEDFALTLSGAVETDTRGSFGVALVGSMVFPTASIFPSVSFGLGVPVQCAPDPAGGVRLELTVQARILGLTTSIDRYPRLDAWRWTWAFVVSL